MMKGPRYSVPKVSQQLFNVEIGVLRQKEVSVGPIDEDFRASFAECRPEHSRFSSLKARGERRRKEASSAWGLARSGALARDEKNLVPKKGFPFPVTFIILKSRVGS